MIIVTIKLNKRENRTESPPQDLFVKLFKHSIYKCIRLTLEFTRNWVLKPTPQTKLTSITNKILKRNQD